MPDKFGPGKFSLNCGKPWYELSPLLEAAAAATATAAAAAATATAAAAAEVLDGGRYLKTRPLTLLQEPATFTWWLKTRAERECSD